MFIINDLIRFKRKIQKGFLCLVQSVTLRRLYRELHLVGTIERKRFSELVPQFSTRYSIVKKDSPLSHSEWRNHVQDLERVFLPSPDFSFLRNPIVSGTMVVDAQGSWLETQMEYLKRHMSDDRLKAVAQENETGAPRLIPALFPTSHNSIHHLFHLVFFEQETGLRLQSFDHIVEWGGGYGNLAKICRRIAGTPLTYSIIDLPIMSCLQWLYLSSVLGPDEVNLVTKDNREIKKNKINLIPLPLLPELSITADLFISTWALSESGPEALRYVVDQQWFGSMHLLLAYQHNDNSFVSAEDVGAMAKQRGAKIKEISFLKRHHYALQ